MIGKFIIGKSFRGTILYCLEDKKLKEGVGLKDRAEVVLYNQCFGNAKELIQQFKEVRQLNQKVAKPVLHIILSLAPGELLGRDKLMDVASDCAYEFGLQNNQIIAISHRDTDHQHLHIVANRIGLDGRTVSDSNSYKKIALFCRKMELKHDLKQVLSPKRYLSKEQRLLPRMDSRKERLKESIRNSIASSRSYIEFETQMKLKGYQVLKRRGIAFLDDKGVKVKGSEVGFSLGRIQHLFKRNKLAQDRGSLILRSATSKTGMSERKAREMGNHRIQKPEHIRQSAPEKVISEALQTLLRPEKESEAIDFNLLQQKRKKKKHSQRL